MSKPAKERTKPAAAGWLLLIHQLPPTPAYLRAKIGRHLARVGALAVKNSVYVVPVTEQAHEDLAWVYREIKSGGGEAWICSATFVQGLTDAELARLFQKARDADYAALSEEARAVRRSLPRRGVVPADRRATLEAEVARLRKRLSEIIGIDFFDAAGRAPVEGLIAEVAARLADGDEAANRTTRHASRRAARSSTRCMPLSRADRRCADPVLVRRPV